MKEHRQQLSTTATRCSVQVVYILIHIYSTTYNYSVAFPPLVDTSMSVFIVTITGIMYFASIFRIISRFTVPKAFAESIHKTYTSWLLSF
jgi:uncharacterized membrane protein HdeD (DUF308 family)